MWPFVAVATWWTMRKEKDEAQRERNREIRKHMNSRAVSFGRTLIIEARKL
jgi:hypothetical protein